MGLHGAVMDASLSPGDRTAGLAKAVGDAKGGNTAQLGGGVSELLYVRLSSLMCWDAALLCAWAANGIDCNAVDMAKNDFGVVQANRYERIFGVNPSKNPARVVAGGEGLMGLPKGAFIGFIGNDTGFLRHVMIHVGNGHGAGNKNGCILSAATAGFETLDMRAFFGADAKANGNHVTTMVHMPTTGQTV